MNAVLKPVAQAVTEIYHAKYGASGWSGWGQCAAWEGGGAATIYAAVGSVIHEVSAECLTSGAQASSYIGKVYKSDGFTITFDDEHADTAQKYINTCRDVHKTVGGTMLVEQTLAIDHITGEAGAKSTTDFGIIPPPSGTEMVVADLKTGAGIAVDAQDNGQLAIYALSMLDEYGLVADIKTVRMMIIQPPLNSVSEWVQTVEQLEEFRVKVTAAATAALAPNPVATPGDKSCRWCSKKATCEALRDEVFEAVESVDPADVATDDLSVAMGKADMIEAWLKAIRAETERRLLDGRAVRGFKLVAGKRGNRKWTSEAEAEAMLKTMRVKHDAMYDYKVVSPTTAEKLAAADVIGARQWPKLKALITQSDGKPSVAEENDKRPALVISADEFQPIEVGVPE